MLYQQDIRVCFLILRQFFESSSLPESRLCLGCFLRSLIKKMLQENTWGQLEIVLMGTVIGRQLFLVHRNLAHQFVLEFLRQHAIGKKFDACPHFGDLIQLGFAGSLGKQFLGHELVEPLALVA